MTGRLSPAWTVVVACAFVAALTPAAAQDPPVDSGQVFRGAVDFVRVDAYPRRDGAIVEGLRLEDFQLFEDGQPQTIESFEFVRHAPGLAGDREEPRNRAEAERWVADPRRRVFIIYLDLYHISRASSHQIRGPLMTVLGESIGPSDVVAVMTSETPIGEMAFTQTLNTISAEIERYWEWGLLDAPVWPRTPAEKQLAACGDARSGFEEIIRRFRDIVLFNSLESLVARVSSLRQERTNIILLSEGWTNRRGGVDPRQLRAPMTTGPTLRDVQFGLPTGDMTTATRQMSCGEQRMRLEVDFDDRFKRLIQYANSSNVSFHAIDVGGLQTGVKTAECCAPARPRPAGSPVVLQELAENTDGVATVNSNDIALGLRRVVERTSAYYLLGYSSTNTAADGKYRQIAVRVNQRGVDVTARRGYTAVSAVAQQRADMRTSSTAIPLPVADAFGRLSRWRPDAEILGSAFSDRDVVHIVTEVGRREIESGRWRAGAAVQVELVDSSGAQRAVIEGNIAPGSYSAAIEATRVSLGTGPLRAYIRMVGDAGELSTRIDVIEPAASRLGHARLFRIPTLGRPTPQPMAAPLFRRGERMRIVWQARSPIDDATVRLLDRRGQPLTPGAALQHALDTETGVLTADLHLAALADGEYLIEVTAIDGDEAEREGLAFRVGR